MKQKKIWTGIGIFLLVTAMVTAYVWKESRGSESVEVTKLKKAEVSEEIMASGTLVSGRQQAVYLQPERGDVKKIAVKAGEKVKKGDTLIQYESPSLEAERRQAELQVEMAETKRSNLYQQLDELEENGGRVSGVMGNVTTEDQVRREIRLAELELKQAKANLAGIEERLAQLKVKSKYDGTVVQVNSESEATHGSTPLVVVADLDRLMVEADVSEFEALKVKKGQKVTIRSDALPEKKWEGEVTKVALMPEENTAFSVQSGNEGGQVRYPLEIKPEEEIPVKLGSQLIVDIAVSSEKVWSLPETAIVREGEKAFVFVAKGGKALKRSVKTGDGDNRRVEIISGIEPGEQVIVEPSEELVNGAEVTVR